MSPKTKAMHSSQDNWEINPHGSYHNQHPQRDSQFFELYKEPLLYSSCCDAESDLSDSEREIFEFHQSRVLLARKRMDEVEMNLQREKLSRESFKWVDDCTPSSKRTKINQDSSRSTLIQTMKESAEVFPEQDILIMKMNIMISMLVMAVTCSATIFFLGL